MPNFLIAHENSLASQAAYWSECHQLFVKMNGYQIAGDLTHLLAIIFLLFKLLKTKCAAGVSGKTQLLYAVIFCSRYSDLFSNTSSLYFPVYKIVFISLTLSTTYLIFKRYKKTYEKELDVFRIEFLVVPCILLACFYNYDFTPPEILWAFSIYLEAVVIIPQIVIIHKAGRAEKYIMPYILLLTTYRVLYIFNWIHKAVYLIGRPDTISYRSGYTQVLIYVGFLIYYVLYIKDKTASSNHYVANLPEYINNEKLLGEKASSDIPGIFIIGSKQSYEQPKKIDQAAA